MVSGAISSLSLQLQTAILATLRLFSLLRRPESMAPIALPITQGDLPYDSGFLSEKREKRAPSRRLIHSATALYALIATASLLLVFCLSRTAGPRLLGSRIAGPRWSTDGVATSRHLASFNDEEPTCPVQPAPLVPRFPFEASASYVDEVATRLGQAVSFPTVSYDDNGLVGDDVRGFSRLN